MLLAGSRAGTDPVAMAAGVLHKGLVQIAGKPMISHVVATLRAMPEIRRIILVCDHPGTLRTADEVACGEAAGVIIMALAGASPARSIAQLFDLPDFVPPVLVATADAPLLTPAMLRHFWNAGPAEAAIAAAVTPGAGVQARFPESKRTFLKFREGEFCGCNLFAIASTDARRVVEFWQRLEDHRKRPLRMAAALGPRIVLAYLTRQLSLARVEHFISGQTGAMAAIVPIPFPEAAVDVDKPEDIPVVERVLAERQAADAN